MNQHKGPDVHVTTNPNATGKDDKWQAKEAGAKDPLATRRTQEAAKEVADVRAERNHSETVIHRPDGTIRDKNSHGDESPKHDKDGHSGKGKK
jgi:hypothetical protein